MVEDQPRYTHKPEKEEEAEAREDIQALLMVAMVVLLLFGLTMLFYSYKSIRKSIREARMSSEMRDCRYNLKAIHLALEMYRNNHWGRLPGDLQELPRIDREEGFELHMLHCPATGRPYEDSRGTDYVYFAPPQNEAQFTREDANTILVVDWPGNHERGGNALFSDGHIEFVEIPDLHEYMRFVRALRQNERHLIQQYVPHAANGF
jgi:prepilin-type processing-associated H-X9-DG protein